MLAPVPALAVVTETRTEQLVASVLHRMYRWPRTARVGQSAQAAQVEQSSQVAPVEQMGLAGGPPAAEEALQMQSSTTVAVVAVRQKLVVVRWV